MDARISGEIHLERGLNPYKSFESGLKANGYLTMSSGVIKNVFIFNEMRKAMEKIPPLVLTAKSLKPYADQETKEGGFIFDSGDIDFEFINGHFDIHRTSLIQKDSLSLKAKGYINRQKEVKGEGNIILSKKLYNELIKTQHTFQPIQSGNNISVPVLIKGEIGKIKLSPNFEVLVKKMLPSIIEHIFNHLDKIPTLPWIKEKNDDKNHNSGASLF